MALPSREDFARLEQTLSEVVTRLDTLIGIQRAAQQPVTLTVYAHGEITEDEARAVAACIFTAAPDVTPAEVRHLIGTAQAIADGYAADPDVPERIRTALERLKVAAGQAAQ